MDSKGWKRLAYLDVGDHLRRERGEREGVPDGVVEVTVERLEAVAAHTLGYERVVVGFEPVGHPLLGLLHGAGAAEVGAELRA